MNLPIKFRAWDTKTGKWTEPHHIAIDGNGSLMNTFSGEYLDETRWLVSWYVALSDMKGIEICDGDILEYVPPTGEEDVQPRDIYLVEWKGCGFRATWWKDGAAAKNQGMDGLMGSDEDMLIIGNIYEKPELLETRS